MSSWGYKFEDFMTTDVRRQRRSDPLDDQHGVDESEEFCCVYRTRLASNSIVFGAEMDGVQDSKSLRVIHVSKVPVKIC